jgi:hypothetical protein
LGNLFEFSVAEIIQYSRNFCTASPNAMKLIPCTPPPPPELSKESKEANLKHGGLVNLMSTKQNKQTTFLHR